jgi:hypothetical protein
MVAWLVVYCCSKRRWMVVFMASKVAGFWLIVSRAMATRLVFVMEDMAAMLGGSGTWPPDT